MRNDVRFDQDPVADALDDMAALGLHWTRNRERGRMPSGIRAAMLLVAQEVISAEKSREAEAQRFIEAYERANGTAR